MSGERIKGVANDFVLREYASCASGVCIPGSTGTATSAAHQNHSQMLAWHSSPWTTATGRSSGEAGFHTGGPRVDQEGLDEVARLRAADSGLRASWIELDSDRHI